MADIKTLAHVETLTTLGSSAHASLRLILPPSNVIRQHCALHPSRICLVTKQALQFCTRGWEKMPTGQKQLSPEVHLLCPGNNNEMMSPVEHVLRQPQVKTQAFQFRELCSPTLQEQISTVSIANCWCSPSAGRSSSVFSGYHIV